MHAGGVQENIMKKHTSSKWLGTAALGLFVLSPISQVLAETKANNLEPVVVTANRIDLLDTEAPYATEIYTWDQIQKTGSTNIYDFLGRHTSMMVTPGSGNPFAQKIDMRGFGVGDGYQNIIVTIDGRRMNNIDMQPQLLTSIPLINIERIEIIKGSGSVAQGDGATAGTLNIVTRKRSGGSASVFAGSQGKLASSVNLGVVKDKYALNLSADNASYDGFRDANSKGQKDASTANNLKADLQVFPTEILELRVGAAVTRIDTAYGSPMTKAEFNAKPEQMTYPSWGGEDDAFTLQRLESDVLSLGASVNLTDTLTLAVDHAREDKMSQYKGSKGADYEYNSTDLSLKYTANGFSLIAGAQAFDGERDAFGSETTKDNLGAFLQSQYKFGSSLVSVGVRHEKVTYEYKPTTGTQLKDDHKLTAWDVGFNQQFSKAVSGFINLNQAFQAPDIDRFFKFGGGFNDFIEPAETKTINLGVNHVQENNKLKATAFYTQLENEIYYYNVSFADKNTNIDKSYKYGVEVQDKFKLTSQLSGSVNYTWLKAIIDKENEAAGAYNGKDLPGVSEHNISLSLDYAITDKSTVMLTQVWRSKAYAAEDFANNFSQKQKAYNLTNLGYSHKLEQVTLFAQVDNVFDKANGIWVKDDAIYPVNFTRTWQLGARLDF